MRIFLSNEDNSGVALYRSYWPWKHCRDELAERGITLIAGGPATGVAPCDEDDAFYFGRAPKPSEMPLFFFLKKSGKRLLWDLEDNYLRIPQHFSCYRPSIEGNTALVLSMVLEFSDHITVCSNPLKAYLEEHNEYTRGRVTTLPNLLDANYFRAASRRVGPPRILWAGGDSHVPDLEMIGPVFERIVNETDWTVVFMGAPMTLPECVMRLPTDRVLIYGFTNARAYPSVLCDIAPDVGLCPLTGTEFDRSKTAIKWMEYTLAGAATVASDFGPYTDEIEHDRTGLLLPTTADPDAWFEAIGRAADSRERLLRAAREVVDARHTWQSPSRQLWVDFFVEQAEAAAAAANADARFAIA